VALKDSLKEHPVISSIAAIMVLLSAGNATTVIQTFRFVDSVATKEYVAAYVAQTVDTRVKGVEGKIDVLGTDLGRVRAFTEVVPELRNLLTLKCMGSSGLDSTIARLKREYRALASEDYQEPPCERLLAGR